MFQSFDCTEICLPIHKNVSLGVEAREYLPMDERDALDGLLLISMEIPFFSIFVVFIFIFEILIFAALKYYRKI